MAFNGNGVFQRLYSWVTDAANNVQPQASRFDAEDNGFAAGLSNCITKDGQQVITNNIPLNGFRLTGLGDPVGAQDAVTANILSNPSSTTAPAWMKVLAAETTATITPLYGYPVFDVRRAGAVGDSTTECVTAIQKTLDAARLAGGGIVTCGYGDTYKITGKLQIGQGTTLQLNGATIKQYSTNTPIIEVSGGGSSLISKWGVRGGVLAYAVQAGGSDTNSIGIRMAVAGGTTFDGLVVDVQVNNAYRGFDVPNVGGAFAFLTTMINTIANNSVDYGYFIQGDTSSGGCTNFTLINPWVLQPSGAPIATSKGYWFSGVSQLSILSAAADWIQTALIYQFTNCDGFIGSLAAESCSATASSGVDSMFFFDTCNFRIGALKLLSCSQTISGTADASMLRVSASVLDVTYMFNKGTTVSDSSSGAYYAAYVSSTGSRVRIQGYGSSGTTPAVALADFGAAFQITEFNGQKRDLCTLTYSASIVIDCSLANNFVVTPTDTNNFAFAAPINPMPGQTITVMVRNNIGTLGTITWDASFLLPTFTKPGNTFSSTQSFRYNGSNHVQVTPATAAVPN